MSDRMVFPLNQTLTNQIPQQIIYTCKTLKLTWLFVIDPIKVMVEIASAGTKTLIYGAFGNLALSIFL